MDVPQTMQCIEISEPGGPQVLVQSERPIPVPGANELLIKVVAAGVNRPDVFQRMGQYPAPKGASDLPGLEVSGKVLAVGGEDLAFTVGDSVCALLSGGGYAEYALANVNTCLSIPNGMNPIYAAALPETTFTVWHNVFDRCHLSTGESFLVHGGASGIGTTAIQMAKAQGCEVIVTAGSDDKCSACLEAGADIAINYKEQKFVDVVRNRPNKGVDVILDMVGGSYIADNIKCLRPDGRLAFIAFLGGSIANIDYMPVMLKRLTITGSTLRTRSNAIKENIASSVRKTVWPWIENGQFKPIIDRILPLSKAAQAHEIMENNEHIGKILLKT